MIWKSDGSCLFGSTDVVGATSWLDWIAISEWIANEVIDPLGVVQKPIRHRGHEERCRLSELLDYSPSTRRQAPVESESFADFCSPMPDANSGVFFSWKMCEDFSLSRGAGTRDCAISLPACWKR